MQFVIDPGRADQRAVSFMSASSSEPGLITPLQLTPTILASYTGDMAKLLHFERKTMWHGLQSGEYIHVKIAFSNDELASMMVALAAAAALMAIVAPYLAPQIASRLHDAYEEMLSNTGHWGMVFGWDANFLPPIGSYVYPYGLIRLDGPPPESM